MSGRLIDTQAWDEAPGGGFDETAMDDLPSFPATPEPTPPQQYRQPPQQVWQQPQVEYEPEPVQQSPLMARMGEAQRRFAKASYYQELMSGSFFSSQDDISAEVEGELKTFVETRLAILLGLEVEQTAAATGSFSETEVVVLKAIVAQVQKAKGKAPEGPKAPAAPPRPRLQPRQAPEAVRPQQPVQPRPQQQPVQPRPPQAPPRAQQPRQEAAPPGPKAGFPPDESVVLEGGRKFKIKHQEMYQSEMTESLQNRLFRMPIGRYAVLADGTKVMRQGPETFIKAVLMNITQQTRGTGGVPFPTEKGQMEAMVNMKSNEAVSNYSPKVSNVAATVISEG